MIALKNVLVATDFSEPSDVALGYGRHFARTFGASLHVLHVVENVMARFAADAYPVLLPDLQREVEEAGEKKLIGSLDNEDFQQLRAVPVVVTSAAPAAAIVVLLPVYLAEIGVDVREASWALHGVLAYTLLIAFMMVSTIPTISSPAAPSWAIRSRLSSVAPAIWRTADSAAPAVPAISYDDDASCWTDSAMLAAWASSLSRLGAARRGEVVFAFKGEDAKETVQ